MLNCGTQCIHLVPASQFVARPRHQEIVEALVFLARSYHVVDPWDCVSNA